MSEQKDLGGKQTPDSIRERGKALEDSFFKKMESEKLDRLRIEHRQQVTLDGLSAASGVTDAAFLNLALELGIAAETLTALTLVPLVQVAWADGTVDDRERKAVLAAAKEAGVTADSAAAEMLGGWLDSRPYPVLFDAWKQYVAALRGELDPAKFEVVRAGVTERAVAVAESARGYLGLGAKISKVERDVLDEIEQAFTGA